MPAPPTAVPRIRGALGLLVLLAAPCVEAGQAAAPAPPKDPDKLVRLLGSDTAAVRDAALEALVALGDKAAPALTAALKHRDPEIRWRAQEARHRIRWAIGPKLAPRIGDLMDGFPTQPVGAREMVCRDLAMVGLVDAVPTLTRILKTDPSKAVRQAAARALIILGDDGLAALLAAGVKTDGLNPYTVSVRVHLGNRYLERGVYDKALEQYNLGLKIDAKNSILHYNIACTYSRMKKIPQALDALERAVAHGYRDVAWMQKDADLENLHDEPRFRALVRKLREQVDDDDR